MGEPTVTVLLSQFDALREEIKTRSTAQTTLLTANITAIGVISGLAFSDRGAGAQILLVVPILSPMLGMLWIDHAINIGCIGVFLQTEVLPAVGQAAGLKHVPNYELKVRDLEGRRMLRIFVFGFPIFLLFAGLPIAALLYMLLLPGNMAGAVFWGPFLLGAGLVAIFLWMWLRLVLQPIEAWSSGEGRRAPP
jgi:hypothetical protein